MLAFSTDGKTLYNESIFYFLKKQFASVDSVLLAQTPFDRKHKI